MPHKSSPYTEYSVNHVITDLNQALHAPSLFNAEALAIYAADLLSQWKIKGAIAYKTPPTVTTEVSYIGPNEVLFDGQIIETWVTEHFVEIQKPDAFEQEAYELAKFYVKLHTYETEHHGPVLVKQGQLAESFMKKWFGNAQQ